MAANQIELGQKIGDSLKPVFSDLGLTLDTFVVENLSLPDELQKRLDERIGMNMVGDMGRYTQFQVAQSMPIAAANEGGGAAGIGVGLGAGLTMAQSMMNADETRTERASRGPIRRRAHSVSSRGNRVRNKILYQLRQVHAARCEVLPGVRRRPAVAHVRLRMGDRGSRL